MTAPTNIGEWRDKDVLIDADEKLGKLVDIYYDAETDERPRPNVHVNEASHPAT